MPRSKAGKPARQGAKGIGPERVFLAVLKHYQVPLPVPEHQFATSLGRKWRFDWAWVAERVALEVQGGIWMRGKTLGAHAMPTNIQRDHAKFSAAACLGWRILYVEPRQLATPATAALIRTALAWDPAKDSLLTP